LEEGVNVWLGSMTMNTEIWRHIFDAIEDPAFLHDTQFRVLHANVAYCREVNVAERKTLGVDLHVPLEHAKNLRWFRE
jgi:PAS domain-containing protein